MLVALAISHLLMPTALTLQDYLKLVHVKMEGVCLISGLLSESNVPTPIDPTTHQSS